MPYKSFWAIAAAVLFTLLAACFIPLAGLQNDESLFSSPLYSNISQDLAARLGRFDLPLMVMTYLGSLKSFLYWPILSVFGASAWTVRLPVVLVGAATVFVFYHLVAIALGRKAAIAGAFLLATDPTFLLTDTFDWGPVALEHFFLVTACWALCRLGTIPGPTVSIRDARVRYLALAFLCCGLAMWNKAIFSWAFAGLIAGGVLVLGWRFWGEITRRNMVVAIVAFCFGAAPLIFYNLRHNLITFSQNAHLEPAAAPGKWIQVHSATDGQTLFGYLVNEEEARPRKDPESWLGRASVWLRARLGQQRRTGFYYLLGALLLAIPLWWRSRAAWFSLIFCGVTWLLMASTHDAGGAAHHVVLLWPFPTLFAVAALASIPWRAPLIVVSVGLGMMNLVVLNQYFSQFVQYGAGDAFTDAIFPLSAALEESSIQTYYITDWGLFDSLNLLHRGRLTLRIASGPLTPENPSPEEVEDIQRMLHDPQAIFVGHVPAKEAFSGVGKHLDQRAAEAGLVRRGMRTVPDSNGRPVFEVFRLAAP